MAAGLPDRGLRLGRIRPHRVLPRGAAFTGLLLLLLAALDSAARAARGDAGDAPGVAALALLALLVRRRHLREPLPWADALVRAARAAARRVREETAAAGIDLRGTPPLPRGFPPILGAGAAALAALAAVLALAPGLDPVAVRAAVHGVSPLLWLVPLGASWALFGIGSFYLLFLTFALTHDELVRSHDGPGPRPRRRELLCLCAWVAAVLAAWTLLPAWAPAAVHAACLAVAVLALGLPGGPDAALLWRRRGRPARLRSASWRTHMLVGTALVGLALADSVLFVRAGEIRGGGPGALEAALPLTAALSSLFAWTGAAALAGWAHLVARTALRARLLDPARPSPTEVLVTDPLPPRERRRLRAALGASGIRASFAARPRRRTEVEVGIAGLEAPGAVGRIVRRDEFQRRRILVRGLERLFRRAARRRFGRGQGFWVAPWHWFCIGLSRDEDERAFDWEEGTFFLETVGPAYERVLPRPVLQHARRVMGDLEVDLVFVEDGVSFRRFRRVLRMCFEVHDKLGGRRRAEERHFTGIPGVRVVIHDYSMDEPFRARRPGYPEPDYETVGRARILHVFRDRGEQDSPVEAPRDRAGAPLLA